ncbi:MAG: M56 family metallopeptidase [Cytophagales bacterium]|nr:M56 family metallopeptidase [Cytophagales bacterium]
MEEIPIYFLKVVLLQTILYALFRLTCHKETNFQFNRFFLLVILVLPLAVPFLKIQVNIFGSENPSEGFIDPWYFIEQSLPVVTINGARSLSTGFTTWMLVLISLYLLVAISSAIGLTADYSKLYKLEKTSCKKEYTASGYRLFYVSSNILSFSFLNRIFISVLFPLRPEEKNTIVKHEEYHLAQKHSLDVILAEVVRIICWFNPIVYLIQRNLKETHEYLADRHTVAQYGSNDYTGLLRSFKWQEINMMLGSAYSGASIKKRISMIEQSGKKSTMLKVISLSMLSFFTAFIFACENELDAFETRDNNTFQYSLSKADLEKEIDIHIARLKNAPKDLIDQYISMQRSEPAYYYMPSVNWITASQAAPLTPDKIKNGSKKFGFLDMEVEFFRMLNNDEIGKFFPQEIVDKADIISGYAIINKMDRYRYMEYKHKMNIEDNSIHDNYDKMASFEGGMEALALHLKENLRYPEVAKKRGIEDQLVMRFVITKHGGLVYLNIDQLPSTTDKEVSLEFQKAAYYALRATEGKWEPAEKDGKYVMSKMTLPIEFKLDKKEQ